MTHLSMGGRSPLRLYAITGRADATIPTGSAVIATYSDFAAFKAAVLPVAAGDQVQLAGWPTPGDCARLVASWDNVDAFEWGQA